MATPKDTLTAYTQALNTIATQTFDPGRLIEFTYSADASLTLTLTGSLASGITAGHVYGIAVRGLAEPIYATFLGMYTTPAGADGYVLKFKRLSPDAEKIVKAVLAELDTHETKPDKSYTLAQLDAMRSSMYTPKDFKVKDYFCFTYDGHTYWREGEGNNP